MSYLTMDFFNMQDYSLICLKIKMNRQSNYKIWILGQPRSIMDITVLDKKGPDICKYSHYYKHPQGRNQMESKEKPAKNGFCLH